VSDDANLAFIRDFYDDWTRGDFRRGDIFGEDAEFVTAVPEVHTYRGPGGAWEGWHDFLTAWEDFRVDVEEIVGLGGDVYLVLARLHGRGKESGVPIDGDGANVIVVEGGLISRFEIHFDRSEAGRVAEQLAAERSTRT
jgi:ketosteroid isomerase-like protein